MIDLSAGAQGALRFPDAARRQLEALAERTGETVTVSGWNGQESVNVEQIAGAGPLVNVSPPGRINPAHCTSTGKIFLAFLDEAVRQDVLAKPLMAYTEHTITDPATIEDQLGEIRRRGYSVNDREYDHDIVAIGAPIFGASRKVIYAISVTVPFFRCDEAKFEWLSQEAVSTAKLISASFGYSETRPPLKETQPPDISGHPHKYAQGNWRGHR